MNREEYIERMRTLTGDYINAIRDYDPANEETLQNVLGIAEKIRGQTHSVFDALDIEFREFQTVPVEEISLDDLLETLKFPADGDGE